jgi:hypothetical protein
MQPIPALPPHAQSAADPARHLAEAAMAQAAALGRRDGLQGGYRNFMLQPAGAGLDLLDDRQQHQAWLPQELAQGPVLLAAVQHCYAAGHAHGTDVRRENQERRRRAELPVQSPHLEGVAES